MCSLLLDKCSNSVTSITSITLEQKKKADIVIQENEYKVKTKIS